MKSVLTDRKVFDRYLTHAEETRLFRHVARVENLLAKRDLAWMTLLRQTGIRVGALAGLLVRDAHTALATGELQLRDEISKGRRGYTVYLHKESTATLRKLLEIRRQQGFPAFPDEPLLMSVKRQGLSVRSLQARMQQWVRSAGLPRAASPHWWRHTLAINMIQNSVAREPARFVQLALGHRSISSTLLYTHPTREEMVTAMRTAQ